MFPWNANQSEDCSAGTKTGTRVRSHVPSERKPERGYIRQNHPFTKPPSCLPMIILWFCGLRVCICSRSRAQFTAIWDLLQWAWKLRLSAFARVCKHPLCGTLSGLTPEYCGKRPPEQWELWEGKPLKPYHFNRTLGAQRASSKHCQTSTAKQRELWEQNGL